MERQTFRRLGLHQRLTFHYNPFALRSLHKLFNIIRGMASPYFSSYIYIYIAGRMKNAASPTKNATCEQDPDAFPKRSE